MTTYEVVTDTCSIPKTNKRHAITLARHLCGNGYQRARVERVVESSLVGNEIVAAYRQIGGKTCRTNT